MGGSVSRELRLHLARAECVPFLVWRTAGAGQRVGDLGMAAVERQVGPLFGPAGGAVRQDVLAAAGAAYRKANGIAAKNEGGGEEDESGKG